MKIALLGSTGFLGSELLRKCVEHGHEIKVLVRNPQKLGEFANAVTIVEGDYFDPNKVAEAVDKVDVVISTIGPSTKKPTEIAEYSSCMTDAMKSLISSLEAKRTKKIILIGGAATPILDCEEFNFRQKLIRSMLNASASYILSIKTAECNLLSRSTLDWVIVRPPAITKGKPTNHVAADERKLAGLTIDRADLVDFIFEQITSDEWVHKAPLVCSKNR